MGKYTKKYEAQRIFSVNLSDGTEITLKNYPNKFQKRLLSASISEDYKLAYKEIINVLNESIISPEGFDLFNVPYFDIHKLFLALVKSSYSNKISVTLKCGHKIEKEIKDPETDEIKKIKTECEGEINSVIDLDQIVVENIQDLVYETENFNLKFRYPNFTEYAYFVDKLSTDDPAAKFLAIAELIQTCIYEVEDDEQKELFKELDTEDQEFIIDSVNPTLLSKVATDLISPYLCAQIPFICPECGHRKKVELKGFDNFFR